jgi:hypothetical protein
MTPKTRSKNMSARGRKYRKIIPELMLSFDGSGYMGFSK